MPTRHILLARTHDAGRHAQLFVAAREVLGRALGVTTAPLAERVVEKVGRALGALVVGEVGLAIALARQRVARLSDRARLVALTLDALRIFVVAGRALIALGTAAAFFARALLLVAVECARGTARALGVAFACFSHTQIKKEGLIKSDFETRFCESCWISPRKELKNSSFSCVKHFQIKSKKTWKKKLIQFLTPTKKSLKISNLKEETTFSIDVSFLPILFKTYRE